MSSIQCGEELWEVTKTYSESPYRFQKNVVGMDKSGTMETLLERVVGDERMRQD